MSNPKCKAQNITAILQKKKKKKLFGLSAAKVILFSAKHVFYYCQQEYHGTMYHWQTKLLIL